MEILVWALHRDAESAGERVPDTTTLWAIVREDEPRLRAYYRIVSNELVELLWVEATS